MILSLLDPLEQRERIWEVRRFERSGAQHPAVEPNSTDGNFHEIFSIALTFLGFCGDSSIGGMPRLALHLQTRHVFFQVRTWTHSHALASAEPSDIKHGPVP
jgi:hypothetical protein